MSAVVWLMTILPYILKRTTGRQHNPMITAGSYPPIHIDLGKDEPGMTLQFRQIERGYIVWRDYTVDGEAVLSPVDIEKLSPGKYRLI